MRRTILAKLVLTLVVAVLGAGALIGAHNQAWAGEKTLRILYSGDVAGYLEPCG